MNRLQRPHPGYPGTVSAFSFAEYFLINNLIFAATVIGHAHQLWVESSHYVNQLILSLHYLVNIFVGCRRLISM
jgi:hypothetical protein